MTIRVLLILVFAHGPPLVGRKRVKGYPRSELLTVLQDSYIEYGRIMHLDVIKDGKGSGGTDTGAREICFSNSGFLALN